MRYGTGVRCRTADFVEPDMDWEAEQYRRGKIDFAAFSLKNAGREELLRHVGDGHVLVVDQTRIDADTIALLPETRLIIRHGDGYDNVDITAATAANIAVANKPGFWSIEAAEHAMALTVAVATRLPVQQAIAARRGADPDAPWDRSRVYPIQRLPGQTVGVLGYGRTGSHYAHLMHGLGCSVIVHDRSTSPETLRAAGYRPVTLDELVAESDVLSLHVPATEETVGLVDAAFLNRMRTGAILINIARGSLVDTPALTAALNTGKLRGAGLDVTSPEPLPQDHALLGMPQVVVTPHLAWYSEEALWAMRRSIVTDVINFSRGVLPQTVVNPEVIPEVLARGLPGTA